ncbi:MAG: hypothetical protein IKE94_09825 [Aeriscardovia sp.]|nr:hypothetical protein [Aeriscardovia sp.]
MSETKLNKNMTLEQINEWAEERYKKFSEMSQYLNDYGKETFEALYEITWFMPFSDTKEELANNLKEAMDNGKIKKEGTIFKLNYFIKNYLI